MEQSHPPYASGSLTIPRTLLRWLDINFQNGPLARTSTYITLPSFVGNGETWNGFSDIVTSFNFEGPNNFSLVGKKEHITNCQHKCKQVTTASRISNVLHIVKQDIEDQYILSSTESQRLFENHVV